MNKNLLLIVGFLLVAGNLMLSSCGGGSSYEPDPEPTDTTGTTDPDPDPEPTQGDGASLTIEVSISELVIDNDCYQGLKVRVTNYDDYDQIKTISWNTSYDPEGDVATFTGIQSSGSYDVDVYEADEVGVIKEYTKYFSTTAINDEDEFDMVLSLLEADAC